MKPAKWQHNLMTTQTEMPLTYDEKAMGLVIALLVAIASLPFLLYWAVLDRLGKIRDPGTDPLFKEWIKRDVTTAESRD
jgi:hypothetical protein